jgi:hypothetical protein
MVFIAWIQRKWCSDYRNIRLYVHYSFILILVFLSLISLFWKNRSRIMRSPYCPCVCASPLLTFECLNQSLWNLILISWHLSPSQRSTSWIPPISLCVCMCIPLSLLDKGYVKSSPRQRIHTQQYNNCWMRRFLCGPCCTSIKGK